MLEGGLCSARESERPISAGGIGRERILPGLSSTAMLEPAAGDADELTKEQVAARAWRHRLGLPHDATDAHCCFVEEEAYERARQSTAAAIGRSLVLQRPPSSIILGTRGLESLR